jgi:membrane protein
MREPTDDRRTTEAEQDERGPTGARDVPRRPTDLSGASVWAVLRRARLEFSRDRLIDLAAALTYYGLLALAPALVVLVAALGLVGPDVADRALAQTQSLAPGSAAQVLAQLVHQASQSRSGAGLGVIVGLAVSVWSASGYVAAFMRASNVVYDIPEGRPLWKTVPIRIGVTLLAVVVLVASALIVVVSGPVAQQVGQLVGAGDTALALWNVLKWPVLLLLLGVLLAVLFWASPNAKQGGIRWITPGGAVAVLLWVLVSVAFALYVTHVATYNRVYGSLAGVIVFLVWLWLTNIALLLGAEVNAELERARAMTRGVPKDVEPYLEPRDTRAFDDRERRHVERALRHRPGHDE